MKIEEIDYNKLARQAARFMLKEAVSFFARNHSSGGANLVISFKTSFPGVIIPLHLKDSYPSAMTVVLQHRYSQLTVSGDKFSVVLTFKGVNEKLVIPFNAVLTYEDTNNNFSLTLKPEEFETSSDNDSDSSIINNFKGSDNGGRIISIDQLRKK